MRVPFMDLNRQHEPLAAELRVAFDRVLGSSGFILGEEVELFESGFARFCGVEHCIGVASGTAALTIMLRAAGIGRGDEVLVPGHTFIASALAVIHAGAIPICVDVERHTGLIDPAEAEAAVGPATAAILAVHLYGQVCSMDPLRLLAKRHGLLLLEDAAQAHGATYGGVRAGALGDAAAFSFYPSKNLGALGDGGAICTDDHEIAARARQLRDLGRGATSTHAVTGYNERLDGLQAAFLRVKLPHLDDWNSARRRHAAVYRERLAGTVELLEERPGSPCIYHLFPVKTDDRGGLAQRLGEAGLSFGVHYPVALVDQPALEGIASSGSSTNAREWAANELSLPIFSEMTDAELASVSDAVTNSSLRTSSRPATVRETRLNRALEASRSATET